MSESEKSYWLLSETSGIGETRDPRLQRHLPMLEGQWPPQRLPFGQQFGESVKALGVSHEARERHGEPADR